MYEILYGMLLAYPLVAYLFVPVYYNLGITSVYQVKKWLCQYYIRYLPCNFNSFSVVVPVTITYLY